MKKIINVSSCAITVCGDRATLDAIWQATKNIKQPYHIARLPKTGDAERFIVETL